MWIARSVSAVLGSKKSGGSKPNIFSVRKVIRALQRCSAAGLPVRCWHAPLSCCHALHQCVACSVQARRREHHAHHHHKVEQAALPGGQRQQRQRKQRGQGVWRRNLSTCRQGRGALRGGRGSAAGPLRPAHAGSHPYLTYPSLLFAPPYVAKGSDDGHHQIEGWHRPGHQEAAHRVKTQGRGVRVKKHDWVRMSRHRWEETMCMWALLLASNPHHSTTRLPGLPAAAVPTHLPHAHATDADGGPRPTSAQLGEASLHTQHPNK